MAITRKDTLLTPELIEEYTAAGYWSDETLADVFRHNALDFPGKIAYIDDHSQVTWGEVWQISGEVASGLARRGVRRGDVVAVQLPNRLEFVFVLAAVVRLGAVFCQFPPDYRAREIEFILEFSEAHTIVVPGMFRGFDHTEMIDSIRGRLPRLANTVAVTTADSGIALDEDAWVTLDQLRRDLDPADPAPDRPSDANDVMRIAFTSGTTGEPKAVMHTANTTLCMTRRENKERDIDGDATILVLLPVGLNAGFGTIVQVANAGARGVLMEKFSPTALLDLVERHQVTTFLAAPDHVSSLTKEMALIKPYSAEGQPQNAAVRVARQLLAAAFERLIPQIGPVPESGSLRNRLTELLVRKPAVIGHAPTQLALFAWLGMSPATAGDSGDSHSPAVRSLREGSSISIADRLLTSPEARAELGELDPILVVAQLLGPFLFRWLTGLRPVTPADCEHIVDDFLAAHSKR